MEKSSVSSLF